MTAAPNLEPVGDRDYAADMRAVMDAETKGEFQAPVVASQIVAKLRAVDPDLLHGWLDAQAVVLVTQAIGKCDRSARAHVRQTAGRSVFAEAATLHAAGDSRPLDRFLSMPFTVEGNVRKALGEMSAGDLRFAADGYAERAAKNTFYATFLRAMEKKVKRGVVSDQFTDEQLAAMWNSLSS